MWTRKHTNLLMLLVLTTQFVACQREMDASTPLSNAHQFNSQTHLQLEGKTLYLSGTNLAWFNFAKDFGYGLDENKLHNSLQELRAAGGNSVRWWLHTDGSYTPEWEMLDSERMVSSPGAQLIADMRKALDIAAEYEIYLVFSLWSFDMLKNNSYRKPPTQDNYRLLSEDKVLQSYIDNALVPMVRALNGHPQLLAWELFNEPENMTEAWFPQQKDFYGGPVPSLERLQRVQALMSAAIHKTAKQQNQVALVTTGSKSLGKYNSDVAGGINLYRDDRMIAAAEGDSDAVLDFYAPHYYNNENQHGYWSPFHRSIEFWQVDKPVVIGEFHLEDLENSEGVRVKGRDLCRVLKQEGYAGGWGWQWIQHENDISDCLARARR